MDSSKTFLFYIILTLLSSKCISTTTTSQAPAELPGTGESLQTLDNMWRYGNQPDFEASLLEDEDGLGEYLLGVGSLAIYGAIPALLLLVSALPWCCIRCLCNRRCKCCQGQAKEKRQWSFIQRWSARVIVLFTILIFIVFIALGYKANELFSNAFFEENNGIYDILKDDLMGELESFTQEVYDELDVIYQASAENGTIETNANELENWSDEIQTGNDDIVSAIDFYCVTNFEKSVMQDSTTHYVTAVKTIQPQQCDGWKEEVNLWGNGDATEDGVWEIFDDTLAEVVSHMLDARDDIWSGTASIMEDMLTPAQDLVSDFKNDMDSKKEDILNIEDLRIQVYWGIFCLPLLPLLVLLLAWRFRKPFVFTCAYSCSWFVSFLLFLILAMHLPIAGFTQDMCVFLDQAEIDGFEETLSTSPNASLADFGKLADACIQDYRLVDVFDLNSQLNFSTAVEFPHVDVSEYFNFTYWNDHASLLRSTSYVNGYIPSLTGCFENATGHVNCSAASVVFNDVLDDASDVDTQINTTMILAQQIADDMTAVEQTFDPIFEAADNIIDVTRCGFVGDAYFDFKEKTCVDALSALSLMCACIGVNACFSLLLTFTIIRCRKQYKDSHGIPLEDEEEDFLEMVEGDPSRRGSQDRVNRERPEVNAAPNEIII